MSTTRSLAREAERLTPEHQPPFQSVIMQEYQKFQEAIKSATGADVDQAFVCFLCDEDGPDGFTTTVTEFRDGSDKFKLVTISNTSSPPPRTPDVIRHQCLLRRVFFKGPPLQCTKAFIGYSSASDPPANALQTRADVLQAKEHNQFWVFCS